MCIKNRKEAAERKGKAAPDLDSTSVVRSALAEFTTVRGENGAAIVRMSGRHLRWYCEGVADSWLAWRQSYQTVMRRLMPGYYYPLLGEMVHFSDLGYGEIEAIEAAAGEGWGIGAL